jgi:hypothetical protein
MTDQSPTASFAVSPFLDGANVDQPPARHAANPNSLDADMTASSTPAGLGEAALKAIKG